MSQIAIVTASGAEAQMPAPAIRGHDGSPNACLFHTGSLGWCGDGARAVNAKLAGPRDLALVGDGGFLIADTMNHAIRRVLPDQTIVTVAGTGRAGRSGDGGSVLDAELHSPTAVEVVGDGGFLIADAGNNAIRRVHGDGTIETIAGVGSGRGIRFRFPRDVALLPDGDFLVADAGNDRIVRVTPTGRARVVAGTGVPGFSGDGDDARRARLDDPTQVSPTGGGGFLIADRGNQAIRSVSPHGVIETVAGRGNIRDPMTDATALEAALDFPTGVHAIGDGGFLVSERAVVRRVTAGGGITPVAGTGDPGFTADDSRPATASAIDYPTAAVAIGESALLIVDQGNDRIRRVGRDGSTETIAGSGAPLPPALEKREEAFYDASFNDFYIEPDNGNPLTRRAPWILRARFTTGRTAHVTLTARRRTNGSIAERCSDSFQAGHRRVLKCDKRLSTGRYRMALLGRAGRDSAKVSRQLVVRPR